MRAAAISAAAVCATVVSALWAPPPAALAGQSAAPVIEPAVVGFDGRTRPGAWTPVWVDITAGASDIDGLVVVEAIRPSGEPVVAFGAPVRAAAGARVRVFVPAIFFDVRRPGTVHLQAGGRRLVSLPVPPLRTADEILVVLSSEPLGAEAAAARIVRLDVAYVSPDTLPRAWQAYESVRLVVVRDLDERRLDDEQRIALRHWLVSGGRLLVMPAGDDARHLDGPTLGPLRPGGPQGAYGRGRVIQWTRDAADPALIGDPEQTRLWDTVLATSPRAPAPALDAAVPAGRPVPVRTHIIIGTLVLLYVLAIRRTSRWLASLGAVPLLATVALVAAATAGATGLAVVARRDAAGVVSATAIEVMPEIEQGVMYMAGRTVSSHGGPFVMRAPRGLLLRPGPPASVTLVFGEGTQISGRGTGVEFSGSAVVPVAITGSFTRRDGGAVATIVNRSGRLLESPWIYAAGRVQRIAPIRDSAEIMLDEPRWQSADRVARTEENHALLTWAFSRLGADAILKGTPAWLVGWWRDPAWTLTWDGRAQAPLQLVLVPLAAPR